jgi:hypothetical protein
LITQIIFGDEYRSLSSYQQLPVTNSNIRFIKICSNESPVLSHGHNKAYMRILQLLRTLPNNVDTVHITHNTVTCLRNVYIHLHGYASSLIPFHTKNALSWRFDVAGNNKTYPGLHVKCPILTKLGFFRHTFTEVFSMKFQGNKFGGNHADTTCGQMDGQANSMIPFH